MQRKIKWEGVPPFSSFLRFDGAAFSGTRVVIATFLTPQSDAPNPPFFTNAVLIDGTTGRVLGANKWALEPGGNGLVPTREGKFVVLTREGMALYSPRFEALAEFPLRVTHRPGFEAWDVLPSPSRRSIVVKYYVKRGLEVLWLDPDSLQVLRRWVGPEGKFGLLSLPGEENHLELSDHRILAVWNDKGMPGYIAVVAIRDIDGPWREIFRSELIYGQGAQFINEDTILVMHPEGITLLSAEGQVLYTENFAQKKEFALYARPSADGRRFALPLCKMKPADNPAGILPHDVLKRIMVFDLPSRKWVYSLTSKDVEMKYLSGFGLSEDGALLTVMREQAVEVYRLPPPEPELPQ